MLFVASLRRILALARGALCKVERGTNQVFLLHLERIHYLLLVSLVLQLCRLLLYALTEVLLDTVNVPVHSTSPRVETYS